jgi:UDP-N-acetyl-2-amino-2-deoxyglucuronate dehydrogenase
VRWGSGPLFGLVGAAGYVAPRHMNAIRDVGGCLLVALDPSDSVGVLDSYAPDCQFFTSPDRFDRHLDHLRQSGRGLDFLTVCSPNHLHDAHIRLGLRSDADVICEKPLVLTPQGLEDLADSESRSGRRVYTILQLRFHPNVVELGKAVRASNRSDYRVELEYITPRGPWYDQSWKGDIEKSGGVTTNIGIHFFDLLLHIFGAVDDFEIGRHDERNCFGVLKCERAEVRWTLSIDSDLLEAEEPSRRRLTVDDRDLDLSSRFDELHTISYRQILAGNGFGIEAARPSVDLAYRIRALMAGYSA